MLLTIFRGIASGIIYSRRAVGGVRRTFSLVACPDSLKPDLAACYDQADCLRGLIEQSCRDLSEDVWALAETFETFEALEDATYPDFMTAMSLWLTAEQEDPDQPLPKNRDAWIRTTDSFFSSLDRLPPVWRQAVTTALHGEAGYLIGRINAAVGRLQARQDQEDEYWEESGIK